MKQVVINIKQLLLASAGLGPVKMRKDGSYSSEALSSERDRPLCVAKAFKKITIIKSSLKYYEMGRGSRKLKELLGRWGKLSERAPSPMEGTVSLHGTWGKKTPR